MRQVLRSGVLGRPRGMGWGGRRERGLGWGTHVNPRLIHVNVWQKPIQYCKVISLQLIKINEKNKNKNRNFPCHAIFSIQLSFTNPQYTTYLLNYFLIDSLYPLQCNINEDTYFSVLFIKHHFVSCLCFVHYCICTT